jgi:hypothetical protein
LHNPATTIFKRALFPYHAIILLVEHFFMKCAGICKTSRLHENLVPFDDNSAIQSVKIGNLNQLSFASGKSLGLCSGTGFNQPAGVDVREKQWSKAKEAQDGAR